MNGSIACIAAALVLVAAEAAAQSGAPLPGAADELARGRYMVLTGHCNNCHTAGYAARQADVPENQWLLGNPVGFRSELGTAYASNLRLTVRSFTEAQWVAYAKGAKPRPPMPWWSVRETSEGDLRAMYRFIVSLGAAGEPVAAFVPADAEPAPPYEVRRLVR